MDILLPELLFISFFTAVSGVVMPGPSFSLTVGKSLHRGRTAGTSETPSVNTNFKSGKITCLLLDLAPELGKPDVSLSFSQPGPVILSCFGCSMICDLPKIHLVTEKEISSSAKEYVNLETAIQ